MQRIIDLESSLDYVTRKEINFIEDTQEEGNNQEKVLDLMNGLIGKRIIPSAMTIVHLLAGSVLFNTPVPKGTVIPRFLGHQTV